MKFDPKKPHGVVYGHAEAKFVQGDVLFRGDGWPVDMPDDIREAEEINEKAQSAPVDINGSLVTDRVNSAMAFLRNILAGGAVNKTVIFGEAQKNNQEWDDVKEASIKMGIKKLALKNKPEMWSLLEYNPNKG